MNKTIKEKLLPNELLLVASRGEIDACKVLLERVDIDIKKVCIMETNDDGTNALMLAARRGHDEVCNV